jgi:hypothetical protein
MCYLLPWRKVSAVEAMPEEEVIRQSRFGRTTEFRFGEDKLAFSLRDPSGEVSFSTFYNNIDLDNTSTVSVNAGRRYFLIGLVVTVAVGVAIQSNVRSMAGYGLLLCVIIYIAFLVVARTLKLFTVKFTILRPSGQSGNLVRVIHDRNHDRIVARIKAGWVARLRKLHLAINPANPRTGEMQKFRWLLDHGVIDTAEYKGAIADLSAATADGSSARDNVEGRPIRLN